MSGPVHPPILSFERFTRVASGDCEEVRQSVGRIFCAHELKVVGKSQALSTELHFRRGASVSYGSMHYGATVDIDPGRLGTFYLIQLPVRGHETIYCEDRQVVSDRRVGTIISPEPGFRMRHARGTQKLFIRIERGAMERKCEQYYGRSLKGPLNFAPAIPLVGAQTGSLLRLMEWQLREASDGRLLDEPEIARHLEEVLILSLLDTLPHNQRDPLAAPPSLAPAFLKRAVAYVEGHVDEPLTAAEVAEHAGVSIRSLFAGYRKYRDTTPMKHLKSLRLDAVHRALCEPAARCTVTTAALRCGFSHLGMFAAAYQRRFGELPSTTLQRHRDNAIATPSGGQVARSVRNALAPACPRAARHRGAHSSA